jgi:hypothetical protein
MEFLSDLIASSAIITIILAVIAKLLPNEKVYQIGFSIGSAATKFGAARFGHNTWNKVEDFLVNSFGVFFEGLGYGLNSDEIPTEDDPEYKEDKSPKV